MKWPRGKANEKMGEMRDEMMVGGVKFLGQNVIDVLCQLRAAGRKKPVKTNPAPDNCHIA